LQRKSLESGFDRVNGTARNTAVARYDRAIALATAMRHDRALRSNRGKCP
jgi:hypothetical protein